MRSDATPTERHAWRLLRNRNLLGLKFRRQYSMGNFILDFYCPTLRLVLELDGAHHFAEAHASRDAARSAVLESIGIRVVRIPNKDVSEEGLKALILPYVPPLHVCGEGDRG